MDELLEKYCFDNINQVKEIIRGAWRRGPNQSEPMPRAFTVIRALRFLEEFVNTENLNSLINFAYQ